MSLKPLILIMTLTYLAESIYGLPLLTEVPDVTVYSKDNAQHMIYLNSEHYALNHEALQAKNMTCMYHADYLVVMVGDHERCNVVDFKGHIKHDAVETAIEDFRINGVEAVYAGDNHQVFLHPDGSIVGATNPNFEGIAGNESDGRRPAQIDLPPGVVRIFADNEYLTIIQRLPLMTRMLPIKCLDAEMKEWLGQLRELAREATRGESGPASERPVRPFEFWSRS